MTISTLGDIEIQEAHHKTDGFCPSIRMRGLYLRFEDNGPNGFWIIFQAVMYTCTHTLTQNETTVPLEWTLASILQSTAWSRHSSMISHCGTATQPIIVQDYLGLHISMFIRPLLLCTRLKCKMIMLVSMLWIVQKYQLQFYHELHYFGLAIKTIQLQYWGFNSIIQ